MLALHCRRNTCCVSAVSYSFQTTSCSSSAAGISKRLPLLRRLSALRLERLPPTQNAASAALWGYLSLAGCAGGDSQLTRLEVSRPHRCCGHDCGIVSLPKVPPRFTMAAH